MLHFWDYAPPKEVEGSGVLEEVVGSRITSCGRPRRPPSRNLEASSGEYLSVAEAVWHVRQPTNQPVS